MTKCIKSIHRRRGSSHSSPLLAANLRGSKLVKDAPVFRLGDPVGKVVYHPYEDDEDPEIVRQHEKFKLQTAKPLQNYPRTIPYNCGKGGPLADIGVERFEVFNYSYGNAQQTRRHTVLWDYTKGLVRTTPFFKSCGYSKTTPAKVLDLNPGLRDICYSVTGGALVAQGYWMPYEAAKAVAANFAYHIRYALTPIFGPGFPAMCLEPSNENFAKFLISRDIVETCAARTQEWKAATIRTPIFIRDRSESASVEDSHGSRETFESSQYTPSDGMRNRETDLSSVDCNADDEDVSEVPSLYELDISSDPLSLTPSDSSLERRQNNTSTPKAYRRLAGRSNQLTPALSRELTAADFEAARTLLQMSIGTQHHV